MKNFKIGLQLYSIRQEMEQDMDAALKQVKEMGYDYVEFAGYFDHSAEEVKALLDKHGLECVSVHQFFPDAKQSDMDYLKTIGAKFCAVPWYDKQTPGTKEWDETIALFTKNGKILKENGIQQLYHNHDFEFQKADGKYILDCYYETIAPEYLQPEIDTCWVHYAGVSPMKYLLKYSGRIDIVHLKDFTCKTLGNGPVYELIGDEENTKPDNKEENDFRFCPLGQGMQDIPAIIEASEKAGASILIVEQDLSYDIPAMEAAKMSRDYLKSLGY